jgi:hypothetical protein
LELLYDERLLYSSCLCLAVLRCGDKRRERCASQGEKHRKARAEYSTAGELLTDDLRAHRALGLLRSFGDMEDPTYVYPAICPYKDMETVLVAPGGLTSKSFSAALHAVMRTLIDRLGVRTFNVAAQGFEVQRAESTGDAGGGSGEGASDWAWHEGPIDTHTPGGSVLVARVVSRGKLQSRASDFGALEVLAGSSIGVCSLYLATCAASVPCAVLAPIN